MERHLPAIEQRYVRREFQRLAQLVRRHHDGFPRGQPWEMLGDILAGGPALAQDTTRAGRGQGRGTAQRDTTPLKLPFEPTGWKTVWLDHLNYQCADYKKASAFYATLSDEQKARFNTPGSSTTAAAR